MVSSGAGQYLNSSLFIGNNYVYLEETASTNEYLQSLNKEMKLPGGTVISAGYQTRGRGQAGATWESEKDQNIMLSVLLYPKFLKTTNQFALSKAMALAARDFILTFLKDLPVKIKWPNDILVSGQKICGILIENGIKGDQIDYCIIGMGLNINQIFNDGHRASLKSITGIDFDLRETETILFSCIEARYLQLRNHEATISADYLETLFGLNQKRWFKDNINGEDFEGVIKGVHTDGRLVIETDEGEKIYNMKEITQRLTLSSNEG